MEFSPHHRSRGQTRRDAIIATSRRMADSTSDAIIPDTLGNAIAVSSLQSGAVLPATTGILLISQTGEVLATGNGASLPHMFTLDNSNLVITSVKGPNLYVEDHQSPADCNNVKSILSTVQTMILSRLEAIEQKVENFGVRCQQLEEKLQTVLGQLKEGGFNNRFAFSTVRGRSGTIVVGIPPSSFSDGSTSSGGVQLITLNSEDDYPNGSWLGDASNPDMRVRVPIAASDIECLNKTHATPEKLALTLLDYLFDRETQACSNLSGTSKHGKKQLDPLKVYGIRCHLMHKFDITEKDWHRIRLNLDSKCRTAFRRKQRGMPLMVKSFKERCPELDDESICFSGGVQLHGLTLDQDMDLVDGTTISLPISHFGGKTQVIHTDQGDIQVVHATPEQMAEIQQSRQIQIFAGSEES